MSLTVGSLFSGIGGFDLGLERNGIKPVWQVEKDNNCNKVLEKHWVEVARFKNVTEFGKSTISLRPDIICGGPPCQDISVAGHRQGLAGERSGLFYEFARIVDEFRPRWILIENVTGLLSSGERRDMGAVIGTLADIGYMGCYRVLDSQWIGVAQRRRRVFIVGHLGDGTGPLEILFESESMSGDSPPSRETGTRTASTLTSGVAADSGVNAPGRRREDDVNIVAAIDTRPYADNEAKESRLVVAATLNSGGTSGGFRTEPGEHLVYQCQGSNIGPMGTLRSGNGNVPFVMQEGMDRPQSVAFAQNTRDEVRLINGDGSISGALGADVGIKQQTYIQQEMTVRRFTPRECERLQGFPDDWTRYDKDGNELSDSARYRMLGNAVTVNVAEWIGKRFADYLHHGGPA